LSCSALTLLSPGEGDLADDFDPAARDSSFGLTAGFAIGFPLAGPTPAYSIAYADVVDLAGKTRPLARAAQQLSDCLQADVRAGQFVSEGREANLDQRVTVPSASA
jgi:hypothetical protein